MRGWRHVERLLAVSVVFCVVLPGCARVEVGAGASGERAEEGDEGSGQEVANRLTPAEQEAGWILLFDGETLDGWRGFRMQGLPAGWRVDDGAIHLTPPEGEAERADLVTDETFDDFELRLEWAIGAGGNSGIFFRVSEDQDETYASGPEFQILDNAGHRDGRSPLTSAGSNFALHAPAADVTRPLGEFNEVRIVVRGDRVEHWMNGEKLLEYTLWDETWRALVAGSKFAAMPSYGLNRSGHLALQDHGDEVWFRNLEVRRLDTDQ